MTNPDYILAKEFLARLPDDLKVKLCKKTLAGVDNKKQSRKEKIRQHLEYLKPKFTK